MPRPPKPWAEHAAFVEKFKDARQFTNEPLEPRLGNLWNSARGITRRELYRLYG